MVQQGTGYGHLSGPGGHVERQVAAGIRAVDGAAVGQVTLDLVQIPHLKGTVQGNRRRLGLAARHEKGKHDREGRQGPGAATGLLHVGLHGSWRWYRASR